jgi:hypothetical protein
MRRRGLAIPPCFYRQVIIFASIQLIAKTKPPQRRCLPLATVDKEIDEVRYILRDAFGTQKIVKIGSHNGELKIHLRNYKKFTNKSE